MPRWLGSSSTPEWINTLVQDLNVYRRHAVAFVFGGVVCTAIHHVLLHWSSSRTASREKALSEQSSGEKALAEAEAKYEKALAELERQRASLTKSADEKLKKLEKQAMECVTWGKDVKVLGLLPRLWIEALDKDHRYGALLYGYWERWELSNTDETFFDWLNNGPGSLIDLPRYPRRLLAESKLIYLSKHQQRLFRVAVQNGRFVWAMDNTPVSVPDKLELPQTAREEEVSELIEAKLVISRRRDKLLAEALKAVKDAKENKEEPTEKRLNDIAKALIDDGLLCQLRDQYFEERIEADHHVRSDSLIACVVMPTPKPRKRSGDDGASSDGDDLLRSSSVRAVELRLPMPTTLRRDALDWDKFIKAIEHDQGMRMEKSIAQRDDKRKGIFVVDKFGILHCGTKQRGVFQHSSFVRGHCVRMAGGITIENGELKHLSPHSGHYQPMLQPFVAMQDEWKNRGVDFSGVQVADFVKDKHQK